MDSSTSDYQQERSSKLIHVWLWLTQILLAFAFAMAGGFKTFTPEADLVAQGMTMPIVALRVAGVAELLGAVGLILPSVSRILPRLTPLAAALLALVMVLAVIAHLIQGEVTSTLAPVVLGSMCAFVAWGRSKRVPIEPR
ncbi:MAG: DoxX family protein [Myxococcota bacterium]